MNIFKIKNARFCTAIIVLVILLITISPFMVLAFDFFEMGVRAGICLILLFVSAFILIKFSENLIGADLVLQIIDAENKQCTKFILPKGITEERIKRNVLSIGGDFEPTTVFPQPEILKYNFKNSLTVNSSGFETVLSLYSTQFLTETEYKSILTSVDSNSKNLNGRKTPRFLDSEQKKAPLKRIVIALIFADSIEEKFNKNLYDILVKEDKDGFDVTILPCIINFQENSVVFNSAVLPDPFYMNIARNKGIKILKNKIFKRKLNFKNNPNRISSDFGGIDVEQTLFELLKSESQEFKTREKNNRRIFKRMNDKDIIHKNNNLYIKFGDKGVCLYVELDDESKLAIVEFFYLWDFPKTHQISKKTIKEIQSIVINYFSQQGYITRFSSFEEDE